MGGRRCRRVPSARFLPHRIKNIAGNYRFETRRNVVHWTMESRTVWLDISMFRYHSLGCVCVCVWHNLVAKVFWHSGAPSVQMYYICFGFIPLPYHQQKYAEMKKWLAFSECLLNNGQYQCLCGYIFRWCCKRHEKEYGANSNRSWANIAIQSTWLVNRCQRYIHFTFYVVQVTRHTSSKIRNLMMKYLHSTQLSNDK